MAIISKHFEIPIFVIADAFKRGRIAWNPSLKREGTSWLTNEKTLLKELDKKGIKIINHREDKIPKSMFKLIEA